MSRRENRRTRIDRWHRSGHGRDGEHARARANIEMRSLVPSFTYGQFYPLVDETLQKPGPEGKAVSLGDDQFERLVGDAHGLAALLQGSLHVGQVVFGDFPDLVSHQRCEEHDLIDPVPELRRESAFNLAHDFTLNLLDPD